MAEVYKCKLKGQRGFEKLIVIKKLHAHVAQDPEVVANFIDEARLAALLEHENIATIYDFGEMGDSYFIAMEYLFGKDLHSVITRARDKGGPMNLEMALFIGARICEAMEYAHTLRDLQQRPLHIIHRDITPHNVFITYEGKVKIIDFGIAKAELFDNHTKAGVVKGKVSYMSPEQLAGGDIDHRSDIFSISILLYEMLSGQRMYSGDTATLIQKCMDVDYQPLEDIVPGLDPGVYKILHRGLVKDRDRRYQSCQEMREELEDCLFTVTARPSSLRLKEYIRDQFAEDFEVEKQQLFTQASTITGHTAQPDVTRTRFEQANFGSPPPKRPAVSRRWARMAGLSFLTLFLMLVIYLVLFSSTPEKNVHKQVSAGQPREAGRGKAIDRGGVENDNPREKGRDIQELLDKAEKALTEQRLTVPENDSAYTYFKRVLELDEDNAQAQGGLLEISRVYTEFAENSLLLDNFPDTLNYINKGLLVSPGSRELLALKQRVLSKKEQLVASLNVKAQAAFEKNHLTDPAGSSAYDHYRRILHFDAHNRAAQEGLVAIGDRYAVLADKAYRNMQFKKSRLLVQRGLRVVPDNRQLLQLETDLARSTPEILIKSLEKNLNVLIH